jgi:hypothetical protein
MTGANSGLYQIVPLAPFRVETAALSEVENVAPTAAIPASQLMGIGAECVRSSGYTLTRYASAIALLAKEQPLTLFRSVSIYPKSTLGRTTGPLRLKGVHVSEPFSKIDKPTQAPFLGAFVLRVRCQRKDIL